MKIRRTAGPCGYLQPRIGRIRRSGRYRHVGICPYRIYHRSFDAFRKMVEERLARIIHNSYVDRKENFGVILKNKGLPDLSWDDFLPESYDGFRRLIKPDEAVRIINGSYMILSYYDKASRSGLSLMYNVLRDDFFAERRVQNFPNLVPRLRYVVFEGAGESLAETPPARPR